MTSKTLKNLGKNETKCTSKNLGKNQTKCTSKGWSSVPLIQALQDQ